MRVLLTVWFKRNGLLIRKTFDQRVMGKQRIYFVRKKRVRTDRVVSFARAPLVIRWKKKRPACSNYIQHVDAQEIARKNTELVTANTLLCTALAESQKENQTLQKQLLLYQAAVNESFLTQMRFKKEKIAKLRNDMSEFIREDKLKDLDDVISMLSSMGSEVLTFRSPDRSPAVVCASRTSDSPVRLLKRSSCIPLRFGSPRNRPSLSSAQIRESMRLSNKSRPHKVIPVDNIPMTPVHEIESLDETRIPSVGDDCQDLENDFTSPLATEFSPTKTSTERKPKKSVRAASSRVSIFDLPIFDCPTTPIAEVTADEMDTTLQPPEIASFQPSFLYHNSFIDKFGAGVNGRSTEVPPEIESSIDESRIDYKRGKETIASSCYGELTQSPATISAAEIEPKNDVTMSNNNQEHGPEPSPVKEESPRPVNEKKRRASGKSKGEKKASKRPLSVSNSSLSNSGDYSTFNTTSVANLSGNISIRPQRNRKQISYVEPTLNTKLRREK